MNLNAAPRALARFKVLDLSRVRSGPNCVRVLADFGADVIRIEPPAGVDPNEVLFAANREGGDFQNLNRNKRSLTLNLKKPGAYEVLMRLVRDADVLIENWRPDVKAKLGLDYDTTLAMIAGDVIHAERDNQRAQWRVSVAEVERWRRILHPGGSHA